MLLIFFIVLKYIKIFEIRKRKKRIKKTNWYKEILF
jgi:hypothetical protein